MKKKDVVSFLKKLSVSRQVTVDHVFKKDELPQVLRLHGIDGYVDFPMKKCMGKLLKLKNGEVLTIGRLPECDYVADPYEDNLISRIHVVWEKAGDEYRMINCGIYGTTVYSLQKVEPNPVAWEELK